MASAKTLFVKSFTLGRDWKCRNCEAEVPAMQEHGADQGCQNPQPIYLPGAEPVMVSHEAMCIAVAVERNRCAKVAATFAANAKYLAGDRIYQNGARYAAEQIAAKIREGK
jgi:hypothetical protein